MKKELVAAITVVSFILALFSVNFLFNGEFYPLGLPNEQSSAIMYVMLTLWFPVLVFITGRLIIIETEHTKRPRQKKDERESAWTSTRLRDKNSRETAYNSLNDRFIQVTLECETLKKKYKELKGVYEEASKNLDRLRQLEMKVEETRSRAKNAKEQASSVINEISLLKRRIRSESGFSPQTSVILQQILSDLLKHLSHSEDDTDSTLIGVSSVAGELTSSIYEWSSEIELPPLDEDFENCEKAIARVTNRVARERDECHPAIPELFRGIAVELRKQALDMRHQGKLDSARTYAKAATKVAENIEKMYQDKLYHGFLEALKKRTN